MKLPVVFCVLLASQSILPAGEVPGKAPSAATGKPVSGSPPKSSAALSLVQTASRDPEDMKAAISPAEESFWRTDSPDGSKSIVLDNADAMFVLTDKTVGTTIRIPNWQKLDGIEYEVVKWAWKDNETLVAPGWTDEALGHGRRDLGDVKFFIYHCGVPKMPEPIAGPVVRPNMCIRLEGFNRKGQVLLSEVFMYSYDHCGRMAEGEKLLGAFDIVPKER